MATTTVTVATTAPQYGNERDVEREIHVQVQDGRQFYVPDHVGDTVMTAEGYAEVISVTDHNCTGLSGCGGTCGGDHLSDECCVNEIMLEMAQ